MSSSYELQKSMLIDKSHQLSFKMLAKNFILTLLTWGLWICSIMFIIKYAKAIFTQPVLEQFFFHDVFGLMFTVAIVLVLVMLIWSVISKDRRQKKNK
ncbi:HmsD [Aggregatibacter kilianii]|uniref:HmsD n=1 Tax=Aggregatibacter kilianii TaxID=2025884 RepID=UPI0028EEE033|nr:HmsD [Aggregatibacter kilianii]